MKRCLLVAFAGALITPALVWPSPKASYSGAVSTQAQLPKGRPCNEGGAPTIPFKDAREAFVKRGLEIRPRGSVCTPEDLKGAMMYLNAMRSWVYMTDVELRYESATSTLAFARLVGYLPDGRVARSDKTRILPSSFRVIRNMTEIGSVLISAGGNQLHTVPSLKFALNTLGALIFIQDCDWCQVTEADPGAGGDRASAPCQAYAGGNCRDACIGDCQSSGGDPCDCPGWGQWGFCYLIPGVVCQGLCPDAKKCQYVMFNPGQFGCACI